jgi:hypothetical protein
MFSTVWDAPSRFAFSSTNETICGGVRGLETASRRVATFKRF